MHRERRHPYRQVVEDAGTLAPSPVGGDGVLAPEGDSGASCAIDVPHPSGVMTRLRSLPYAIAALVLPVSLVLYVTSLFMHVAQMERRMEVFGIGRSDVEAYRLFDTIEQLWNDGQTGLAVIIVAFTLFFPISKYLALGFVMIGRYDAKRRRTLTWVKHFGQWSMGDVFVVALLVVMARVNSGIAQVSVEPLLGIWIFAASVILSMVASGALGLHFDRERTTS